MIQIVPHYFLKFSWVKKQPGIKEDYYNYTCSGWAMLEKFELENVVVFTEAGIIHELSW